MLLAGDIGGTKTNLAIFSPEAGPRAPLAEATFPSADYPSLEGLVREFLSQVDLKVEWASFGVAGPVAAGRSTITNLPWVMEERQLQEALNLSSVRLLNDLDAIAHAVPFLEPADLHTLNVGQPAPGGAMAVVAPGTGLGEAFLTWDGSRYQPHASEGGHADLWRNSAALRRPTRLKSNCCTISGVASSTSVTSGSACGAIVPLWPGNAQHLRLSQRQRLR